MSLSVRIFFDLRVIRLLYKHKHTRPQEPIHHRFVSFLRSNFSDHFIIHIQFYTFLAYMQAVRAFNIFSFHIHISKIVVSSSTLTSHRIVINQRAFRPTTENTKIKKTEDGEDEYVETESNNNIVCVIEREKKVVIFFFFFRSFHSFYNLYHSSFCFVLWTLNK